MSPRLTDWSIAVTTALAFIAGILSLISGNPQEWFIFALHGIAGLWLLLLLWGKLQRVWPRLLHFRQWDRRTLFGLLATLLVALALGSGIWWVIGGDVSFVNFNLLNWHIALGFALTLAVVLHLFVRAKRLRLRDLTARRRMLHFSSLLLGGAALWPTQQLAEHVLHTEGEKERFTGSRESGSYAGNVFPTSSWVADAPRPLNGGTWQLTLDGAISVSRIFSYNELASVGDKLEATLDCTGGFYSTQYWRGITVGHLLDQVTLSNNARYVSFVSVTSYRWSLPLEEARLALLATHIDEQPLTYEHGFPLRLVAPGRRGFEWVKWIMRIEVQTSPDLGQGLSIFTSSFTNAGRGM